MPGVAGSVSLLCEQPVLERGNEGPDGLEAGDGLRIALDLLLEREDAVDLVFEGLERGRIAPKSSFLRRSMGTSDEETPTSGDGPRTAPHLACPGAEGYNPH